MNLGCIPKDIEATRTLIREVKPNPRIQHISCNWIEHVTDDMEGDPEHAPFLREFLEALGKFPNLSSITLEHMPATDHLINFLKTHPPISKIHLPNEDLFNESTRAKVLALVEEFAHVQEFSAPPKTYLKDKKSLKFRSKFERALHLNRQLALYLPAASAGMKVLLDKKAGNNAELPFIPPEITNELALAIARHVPPAKAEAIFDEIIAQARALEESKTV